jgi:putative transposase
VSGLRLLVDPGLEGLSVERQCELLGLSRSSYYYSPQGESAYNLKLMEIMDKQYLETPFYGVRQMTFHLRNMGYPVNHKRIGRLYQLMALSAVCPGPHTSKPGKGNDYQVFPYLLSGMKISEPGQVVGTDITYVPIRNGFLYLVAFVDWYSRYVLSWELSNTLCTDFCLTALEQVWPQLEVEIINSDQGAQFTSRVFSSAVLANGKTKLSMDGKGRAIDNVFTERLWRSFKYEEVYLKSYADGRQAWQQIRDYWTFYNTSRPNSRLGGHTPADVFFGKAKVAPLHIGNVKNAG